MAANAVAFLVAVNQMLVPAARIVGSQHCQLRCGLLESCVQPYLFAEHASTCVPCSEHRALHSIVRAQDEGVAGKVTEKSSAGPPQLPQTGREAPMGENKKAHTPELG